LLGKSYGGAGKIITFAYIPVGALSITQPKTAPQERYAVLLGYDAASGILSVIALKTIGETLLNQVIKCFALSQAVDRKKLLSDLNLPSETTIAAVVLADRSAEFDLEANRPQISALMQKLGVTIALK
jgi:hypothetical protein